MNGASSVQSLGNLFTTTTTNALDQSMTLSSPQRRQFRMPGGSLGLAKHDVAIPAIPEFQYAQ